MSLADGKPPTPATVRGNFWVTPSDRMPKARYPGGIVADVKTEDPFESLSAARDFARRRAKHEGRTIYIRAGRGPGTFMAIIETFEKEGGQCLRSWRTR